jgi:anionic glutamate receptor
MMTISERIRYLTLTDASKVWMPDTFFRNEKIGQFHNILTPNLYIRVFPDGDVLYSIRCADCFILVFQLLSQRISITCACSMHLALFPLDEQKCTLDVASCESTTIIIYINVSSQTVGRKTT